MTGDGWSTPLVPSPRNPNHDQLSVYKTLYVPTILGTGDPSEYVALALQTDASDNQFATHIRSVARLKINRSESFRTNYAFICATAAIRKSFIRLPEVRRRGGARLVTSLHYSLRDFGSDFVNEKGYNSVCISRLLKVYAFLSYERRVRTLHPYIITNKTVDSNHILHTGACRGKETGSFVH